MNYTVGDFIIRIKNAVLARRNMVVFPYAKVSKNLAELLVKEGFLQNVKEEEIDGRKSLTAHVASEGRVAVLTDVRIISKPSLRVYVSTLELEKQQRKGLGKLIVSTNSGLMTGKEALKKGLGGELLFEIW